jgi:hypothetical protein
VIAEYQKKLA